MVGLSQIAEAHALTKALAGVVASMRMCVCDECDDLHPHAYKTRTKVFPVD